MPSHVVERGDCLSSIAAQHGFRWQDLWEHEDNAGLRAERSDPNLLAVGDEVAIPEPRQEVVRVRTDRRNTCVLRAGVKLRLRLECAGEPIPDEPYRVEFEGGEPLSGTTDETGLLEQTIPASAARVTLVLEGRNEQLTLTLGGLGPVDRPAGAAVRLRNMGLYVGPRIADDETEVSAELREALETLQELEGVAQTGALDDATRQALVRLYGC